MRPPRERWSGYGSVRLDADESHVVFRRRPPLCGHTAGGMGSRTGGVTTLPPQAHSRGGTVGVWGPAAASRRTYTTAPYRVALRQL